MKLSIATLFAAFAVSLAGAQTWTSVKGTPNIGAVNPNLLTDGSVMMQDGATNNWYKLTPDINGNYATGTWTKLASTPSNWAPLYYGSEVMTDGRVIILGGEYNGNGGPVWTNLSGIYDPVTNKWTMITVPFDGSQMGDTATCTLPNGLVYIADPVSQETAAFDPKANKFIFPYGQEPLMYNDEAGLTLLPNGNVFRTDCWQNSTAEVFNTSTKTWSYLPTMPYNVLDSADAEMGPAVVQYDGKLIQFGGNGSNIIFDPSNNSWISAPSFPTNSIGQIDVADGGAVLLPNGKVMIGAGPGYYAGPSQWFLWDGAALTQVSGPPDAANEPGGYYNFVLLPSGQVLVTDFSNNVQLYSPGGSSQTSWAPTITSAPAQVHVGKTYTIYGTQFNGLSQGAAFGDDVQGNTNYPMIRVTMAKTGHVFYAKESNPSTMAICTGNQVVNTQFAMPINSEFGAATIQVVTNGIASTPVQTTILPELAPYAVSVFPGQGTSPTGNVASIATLDGNDFSATSQATSAGQTCAIEADFNVGTGITRVVPYASASAQFGVTEQLYIYSFVTKQWVYITAQPFATSGETAISGTPSGSGAQYVGPTGQVRIVVRGVLPTHISTKPFRMGVDVVGLQFG